MNEKNSIFYIIPDLFKILMLVKSGGTSGSNVM